MNLSVSIVEAFRMLRQEDWMDFERFSAQVLRKERPSDILLLGVAFDKVLEDPDAHRTELTYQCDGYEFERLSVDDLLANFPDGLPQVSACEDIAGHTIRGRCDLIEGLTVHDYKVTKQINTQRYLDSYQWRLYLRMFGCQRFIYHPVQLFQDRDTGLYEPRNYTPVVTYAYPGMKRDVERMVVDCAAFLETSGLAEQIEQERQNRRAA